MTGPDRRRTEDSDIHAGSRGAPRPITIALVLSGDGVLTPVGLTTLSVASGATTSGAAFTLERDTGNGKSVTLVATINGTTRKLTVTMSS